MSDDLVRQSIEELQDIVHCDCAPAYLERGLHSHVCLHYMADAIKIVADRIEELEAKLAKAVDMLCVYTDPLAMNDEDNAALAELLKEEKT